MNDDIIEYIWKVILLLYLIYYSRKNITLQTKVEILEKDREVKTKLIRKLIGVNKDEKNI